MLILYVPLHLLNDSCLQFKQYFNRYIFNNNRKTLNKFIL